MFTVNVFLLIVLKLLEPVIDPFKVPPPTSLDPDMFRFTVKLPELSTAKSVDGLTVNVVGDWLEVNTAVVPLNPFELSNTDAPDIADSIT